MKLQQVIELEIVGLGYEGIGFGYAEERKVFVPLTITGDLVQAKITKINNKAIFAEIIKVVTDSPLRVKPICKHFGVCGGCSLQHLEIQAYHDFKQKLAMDSCRNANCDTTKLKPLIHTEPYSRRRTDLKVKADYLQIQIGYHQPGTHQIVDISECHVLDPIIFNIIQPFRVLIRELDTAGEIKGLSILNSNTGLDIIMDASMKPTPDDLEKMAVFGKNNQLSRLSWQNNKKIIPIIALQPVLNNSAVPIRAGIFQQANTKAEQVIIDLVLQYSKHCKRIIDLYAGYGTYSFQMNEYSSVHAVEGCQEMISAMEIAALRYPPKHQLTFQVQDLFKRPLSAKILSKFDCAVINPPRNGAEPQVRNLALAKIPTIIMVSCHHLSFTRDAKILSNAGYKLVEATVVDQFLWSPHIEIVGIFTL